MRLLILLVVAASGCATFRPLDARQPWAGENRARIDRMMRERGRGSAGWDPANKPVATFDWDNTNVRNDVGDATLYWMLAHDKVRQPPARRWRRTSPLLTDAAVAALDAACASLAEPGRPLPTSTPAGRACATEIVTIYGGGKTTGGAEAFAGFDHRRMEPAYAWATQLEAGWTPDEVRGFARAALDENLAAPVGATQTIGAVAGLAAWIRYYEPIRDLEAALAANGFDVWIISASSQPVAEVFAAKNGIPADHVVGVRALVGEGGRLGYDLAGCGDVPDGNNDGEGHNTGNAIITYIEGKRCFVNQVIFGVRGADALRPGARRQAFTAGDSDTDATFLVDATELRLVINRNRPEVMCRAYHDEDRRWLVNPMFFDPLPKRAAPYPCSTSACFDASGAAGPCLDGAGRPIPDQEDRVFALP